MSVRLYMDVHVPRAITEGLRLRGINILTAQEDDAAGLADSDLLDRATASGRILFTQDSDLLEEAARRQRAGQGFGGVVYAHASPSPGGVGEGVPRSQCGPARGSRPTVRARQI